MPVVARSLPPALHPYFDISWNPWGKQRPVQAFLKLVDAHRIDLNAAYDFSSRPVRHRYSRENQLASFRGTLLEAWHRLHADDWEAHLARHQVSRPLKMYTAWFDWLGALQHEGLRLDVRLDPTDPDATFHGQPMWFDDARSRPLLTAFWLDHGVDPGMRQTSPMQWGVWLSIDALPVSTVQTLLEHGLSPLAPIVAHKDHDKLTALTSLAERVVEAVTANPGFWHTPSDQAQRWHTVASMLIEAIPDPASTMADEARSYETLIREHFPTVWAGMEKRLLTAIATPGTVERPDVRRRL